MNSISSGPFFSPRIVMLACLQNGSSIYLHASQSNGSSRMTWNIVELRYHHPVLLAMVSNTKVWTPSSYSKSFSSLDPYFAAVSSVPSEIAGDAINSLKDCIVNWEQLPVCLLFFHPLTKWSSHQNEEQRKCYQILWRMQKNLWSLLHQPGLRAFFGDVVTNFVSFLLLVLVIVYVTARTVGMIFAGKLRVTLSGFLFISLLFRSGGFY